MFILSFGLKDESMVLKSAMLFNLSSAAGGQYKRGPPPYFNETGFIEE